jgi:hypothetical protein
LEERKGILSGVIVMLKIGQIVCILDKQLLFVEKGKIRTISKKENKTYCQLENYSIISSRWYLEGGDLFENEKDAYLELFKYIQEKTKKEMVRQTEIEHNLEFLNNRMFSVCRNINLLDNPNPSLSVK